MPLRILHAIRSVNPTGGGPVEGVRQLTRINRKLGHSVEVVCFDPPDSKWLSSIDVKVHALGPGMGDYGYTPKYVDWLVANSKNYSCIVINGIWGYNCFGTWRALRKTKVPYFVFTHGMLDPWFKHRHPLKHFKKWLYWPWGTYPVLRDAQAVFFTCEEERRLARESFWLYDCREYVLPYGTAGYPGSSDQRPENVFFEVNPALKGKNIVLFLGRVHPKKGPDLLIKAVALIAKSSPELIANYQFVMAGPDDSSYALELKALISKSGVEKLFYWTGMLLGEQKWGAFRAAEAFTLPSHQENFGLAVAEALSCGTPVLLAKGVNIWPEITTDNAGFADADTVEGTVAILRQWLDLPLSEKQRMRLNARRSYEKHFTAERAANSFVAALYLMLGTKDL